MFNLTLKGFGTRALLSCPCSGGSLDPPLARPLISVDSASSVLRSPLIPSTAHARIHHKATSPLLRTHTNARNSFPLIRLLHGSLATRGVGSRLATPRSLAQSEAAIPFRIIFFAHPHHLIPIESYSCKKHRGWGSVGKPNAFPSGGLRALNPGCPPKPCEPTNAGLGLRTTSLQSHQRLLGSLRGAIPAQRESHTWAAALSRRAAPQDALRPTETGTAARSSQVSAQLPSTRTSCRCTGAARLQTESTQISDSVSAG